MIDIFLLAFINKNTNNSIEWTYDAQDKWQSPEQTIILGAGDCEDIAILKYFQLRSIGVSDDDMRLSFYLLHGAGHVVLSVNGVILDSLSDSIKQDIGGHVYQFNAAGLYLNGKRYNYSSSAPKWDAIIKSRIYAMTGF